MKKKFTAICLTFAVAFSLATAGCGSSGEGESASSAAGSSQDVSGSVSSSKGAETSSDGKYNIAVILKTLSLEYWKYVEAGAKAYAQEHPDTVSVEVTGPSSETSFDEMQNMIETTLTAGVYDGVIISPLQSDTAATLVSGVDIPIIAVDTKFEADEVVSFVGTGNEEAAKQGAIAAVEAAKEAGWETIQCIEIAGVQGDETSGDRFNGYMAGIEEAGGEFLADEVQYSDVAADKAVTCMEAIMQNHPEGIAIICCHTDDVAMAAKRAAAGNEAYENTIFMGFDGNITACEAILSGDLTMSVGQMGYQMGYTAVETMIKAINGEEVEPVIDSGAEILTVDNAQDRIDRLNKQLGNE